MDLVESYWVVNRVLYMLTFAPVWNRLLQLHGPQSYSYIPHVLLTIVTFNRPYYILSNIHKRQPVNEQFLVPGVFQG